LFSSIIVARFDHAGNASEIRSPMLFMGERHPLLIPDLGASPAPTKEDTPRVRRSAPAGRLGRKIRAALPVLGRRRSPAHRTAAFIGAAAIVAVG
jgi:hypothetical protein